MTARPLVGITAHGTMINDDDDGIRVAHSVVGRAYLRAVHRAGGLPILLPLVDPDDADDLLDRVDALVVTGGADVDPTHYGQARSAQCGVTDPERDAVDLAFAKAAVRRNMPTLCICRGVQVLNVAMGGTLVQHVDEHMRIDLYDRDVHDVQVTSGSRLASLLGSSSLSVNSLHHQVIDRPGDRVRIVASNSDGHPEAIEIDGAPAVLGVQWHPELLRHRSEQLALFQSLVSRG